MHSTPPDFIVVGTDTDAGKTTFALLFLAAFPEYAYWKPVETGPSDSEQIRRCVPEVNVHDPVVSFGEAVAPVLAARNVKAFIPSTISLLDSRPSAPLLIETFGSPLSPLNETDLQIELIRRLQVPCVVVTPSTVGAVGRTLACLRALQAEGVNIAGIVLLGERDDYALSELNKQTLTFSVLRPKSWDGNAVARSAAEQRPTLAAIRQSLPPVMPNRDWLALDREHVWHPYTPLRGAAEPLVVVGAKDEFLELADGTRVIDGISSWWTILHGHREPRLIRALHRAASQIDHVHFAGATHPFAIECAEVLNATMPWQGGRVFFSDNGSTAVEVALKMAYQFWCRRGEPERTLFVGFEGGYHGDTFGAMAVGRDPLFFGRFEPLLFETLRIPLTAEALDDALMSNKVAAVIIEPLVQAAGGMRMHSPDLLNELWQVAQRHGVLFIADEVMTGCRTGSFWAHSQAGIEPDLIATGKTLAGGMLTLAATMVSPQVLAAFDTEDRSQTFFHGHSFTANPLACAVAVKNLRMLNEGAWLEDSRRIERFWRENVNRFAAANDVRIQGTVLAMDVPASGGYLADVAAPMREAALREGVLLRPLGNVLYCLPPLRTSDESLERIARAIVAAIMVTQ